MHDTTVIYRIANFINIIYHLIIYILNKKKDRFQLLLIIRYSDIIVICTTTK